MDKVGGTDNAGLYRYQQEKKTEKKEKSGKISFRTVFEAEQNGDIFSPGFVSADENVSLDALLDDVHAAGEELVSRPVLSTIRNYKEAVRRFMSYLVKNAYDLEKETEVVFDKKKVPPLNKKEIVREKIRVIDSKLDKLAAEILHGQRSQLLILKKLEELEGLLIDLKR